jgi:hypothetical protein
MTNPKIRVARMTEDGQWKLLGSYVNYDAADRAVDRFSEEFPNAYIDILDGALSHVQTV